MKLLECKDKLTINELLQIAFEYGNDNADMPADSESITESFNEWIKSNDDLFKKLILPHVSNNEVAVCESCENKLLCKKHGVYGINCVKLNIKETDC